jgi:alpha-beta hydrolase superfamily lysophospholipase
MKISYFFPIILFMVCLQTLHPAKANGRNYRADTSFTETLMTLSTATGDLSGVLTVPAGANKGIVALIISGSGPTDRNGNNPSMQNNSLKMLSAGLAGSGIASLRYDKRGIAGSASAMKKEADLRFEDYVNDAKDWIEKLRKDNRFKQVVVIGHSEGSLVGMIAAKGANKMISIAGIGQPAHNVIKDQLRAQPQGIQDLTFPLLDSLKNGHRVTNPGPAFSSLFRESVQPYLISWFTYDPQAEIKKLQIPVLIIQGTTDIQVSVAEAKLLAAANPKAKLVTIEGMNHVLKNAPADAAANVKIYNDPSLPLVPELLKTITTFILSPTR